MNTIKIENKNNEELNKKESGIFRNFRNAIRVGTAASLIFLATENGLAQTTNAPDKTPPFSIEMVKNYPSLKYVVDNFDKYFKDPEMKKHLEEMIAKIVEQHNQEGVENALKLTLMNLKDPRKKLLGSIGSIEEFVVFDKKFEDKYAKEFDDEALLTAMEDFNKIYDAWIDTELDRLNKILAEQKTVMSGQDKKLVEITARAEETLKSFSSQQVKKDPKLQEVLIKFKSTFKKEEITKLSAHTQELLNLVP